MPPFLHYLALPFVWIAPFIVVMMTIVVIHELGHFYAARCFGVAIDRFSVGFGRALVSWRDKSGVEWRIGWIPLGGYVQFAGDENVASVPDQNDLEAMRADIVAREGPGAADKYLVFKPLWQRAVVAAAGPFANFVLASVIFAVLVMTVGEPSARIDGVTAGSAAAAAGLKPGDVVESVAGRGISSFTDLERVVTVRANVPLTMIVRRGGQDLTLTATPTATKVKNILGWDQEVGQLGVVNIPSRTPGGWHRANPIEAIGLGVSRTWQMADTTVYYLGRAFSGQMSFDQLGGPLRTAQLSHAIATAGMQAGATARRPGVGSRLQPGEHHRDDFGRRRNIQPIADSGSRWRPFGLLRL